MACSLLYIITNAHSSRFQMKDLISKLEALWVSVTFAEAGEHEASREIMSQDIHEAHEAEACPVV
jgi:hypothetical protein